MKYVIVLASSLFLFACSQEETPLSKNTQMQTETGGVESSETLLVPNETTTQAEQDFADELNTLLHTVEETPNE